MMGAKQMITIGLAILLLPAVASPQSEDQENGVDLLSPRGRSIDSKLDTWQFEVASRELQALRKEKPGTAETLYLEGYELFLKGDYSASVVKLRAIETRGIRSQTVRGLREMAEAAQTVIDKHAERRSQNFVIRFPPEDEVLADTALETLEAALAALKQDIGFVPAWPIVVDIYRDAEDLAAVSPLTIAEVERTGTIALCKWGRLMATTPRALRYGYPWLDTLGHELVHYAVSSLTQDRTPVWLQEGFAKFLEARWRSPASAQIAPSMEHLLAKALKKNDLISFDAMHPSMAKLPGAEAAALAFAEVATALSFMYDHGGPDLLRNTLGRINEGADAQSAVAAAMGIAWKDFDGLWRGYMKTRKYRTFTDFEPIAPKLRKHKGGKGPSEDEGSGLGERSTQMLRLGNMLLLAGRARAAAIEYEKGKTTARPGDWLFPVKLGRTYLALGDAARALSSVTRFVEIYPELPWPHLISGRAHLLQNNALWAVDAFNRAIANNPFDPEAQCGLSDAYARINNRSATDDVRWERARRACLALGQQ
jgi:tetratricopeptide (TPR) repeat protein